MHLTTVISEVTKNSLITESHMKSTLYTYVTKVKRVNYIYVKNISTIHTRDEQFLIHLKIKLRIVLLNEIYVPLN